MDPILPYLFQRAWMSLSHLHLLLTCTSTKPSVDELEAPLTRSLGPVLISHWLCVRLAPNFLHCPLSRIVGSSPGHGSPLLLRHGPALNWWPPRPTLRSTSPQPPTGWIPRTTVTTARAARSGIAIRAAQRRRRRHFPLLQSTRYDFRSIKTDFADTNDSSNLPENKSISRRAPPIFVDLAVCIGCVLLDVLIHGGAEGY